jgi:hypothetical protein
MARPVWLSLGRAAQRSVGYASAFERDRSIPPVIMIHGAGISCPSARSCCPTVDASGTPLTRPPRPSGIIWPCFEPRNGSWTGRSVRHIGRRRRHNDEPEEDACEACNTARKERQPLRAQRPTTFFTTKDTKATKATKREKRAYDAHLSDLTRRLHLSALRFPW